MVIATSMSCLRLSYCYEVWGAWLFTNSPILMIWLNYNSQFSFLMQRYAAFLRIIEKNYNPQRIFSIFSIFAPTMLEYAESSASCTFGLLNESAHINFLSRKRKIVKRKKKHQVYLETSIVPFLLQWIWWIIERKNDISASYSLLSWKQTCKRIFLIGVIVRDLGRYCDTSFSHLQVWSTGLKKSMRSMPNRSLNFAPPDLV